MDKVSSCVRPENLIGKGSFATVYRYTNTDGQVYAVKVIDRNLMSPKEMEYINREINIIPGLIHPHIVRSIGIVNDGSIVYMIFEYCANGDLRSYIIRNRVVVGEPLARRLLLQLISGIKYLYDNQIFHRDLKTQNLFLTEDLTLKIGDFGFATKGRNMTKSCIGSPYYMSPELLGKTPSIKSDLWSIGIIFYEMLTGTIPFEGKVKNQAELYTMILTKSIDIPNYISEYARDLLSGLLTVDVNKRIDWDQLFGHRYFTPINNGDIYLQRILRWNIYADIEEFLIPILSPTDNYRPLIDKYLGYSPEDTVLVIPSSGCIVVICDKSDEFVHISSITTTTTFDHKLEYLQVLREYIRGRYNVLSTTTTQLVSTRDDMMSRLAGLNVDVEQNIRSRVNIFLEGYERITKDYNDTIDKSPVNDPTYTTYISTKATKSSPSSKLVDEMNRQLTNSLKRYMDLLYRIEQTIRTYRSLLDEYYCIQPTVNSILEDNLRKQYEERVRSLVRQIDEEFNKERLRRGDRKDRKDRKDRRDEPYHPIREAVKEYMNKYLHMSNLYNKMKAINQSLAEKLVAVYKS